MSKEEGLGWPGRAVGGSPGTPLQTAAGGDCGCEKRLAATAGANVCLLGPCPIPGSMPICGKAIYGNPVCIDLSLSVCVCFGAYSSKQGHACNEAISHCTRALG